MPWVLLALVTGVLLFALLANVRHKERGSGAEAVRAVEDLRQDVRRLTQRVENLEAIAAEEPLHEEAPEQSAHSDRASSARGMHGRERSS